MFWDMEQNQDPPFVRTWKGNGEFLAEEDWIQNYIWGRTAIGGVDIKNRLKKAGIVNETYLLFANRIWNYKTGELFAPEGNVYKLFTSKRNVKNLSGDKRIPWDITEHLTSAEIGE